MKTLGPRHGKLLGAIRKELPGLSPDLLSDLRGGKAVTAEIQGVEVKFEPEDVLISTEQSEDWVCADEGGVQIALSTVLTPDLVREGMARDFVRQVQQLRKDADLEIEDRIEVGFLAADPEVVTAITEWDDYIRGETLANALEKGDAAPDSAKAVKVGEVSVPLWIEKR